MPAPTSGPVLDRFRSSIMGRTRQARPKAAISWETVRQLGMKLPETEEGTSYGAPALKVRGKLFARLHQSGESVVVKIDMSERATRMRADAKAFYITDHYLN